MKKVIAIGLISVFLLLTIAPIMSSAQSNQVLPGKGTVIIYVIGTKAALNGVNINVESDEELSVKHTSINSFISKFSLSAPAGVSLTATIIPGSAKYSSKTRSVMFVGQQTLYALPIFYLF